jgi:anti-sigma factor RsiW
MLSARTRVSSGSCSGRARWNSAGRRLERGRDGYIRVRSGTGNGFSSRVRVGSKEAQTFPALSRSRRNASRDPRRARPSTEQRRRHRTRPLRATSDIFFAASARRLHRQMHQTLVRSRRAARRSCLATAPLVLRVRRRSVRWLCATPSAPSALLSMTDVCYWTQQSQSFDPANRSSSSYYCTMAAFPAPSENHAIPSSMS